MLRQFPAFRGRRLRGRADIRELVRETYLSPRDLIYPMFVVPGKGVESPILSMPGCAQHSIDRLVPAVQRAMSAGIAGIILFGIPEEKDAVGSGAYAHDGIIQRAVQAIKHADDSILVITDVCLCEYTDHGHCGVIQDGNVLNDPTLDLLAREALSHVEAGADIVAPSDMMDGRVKAIRETLDQQGYETTPILAYSAKYASGLYGPFRDAAESAPQFGDRRGYQMDPRNSDEALQEVALDLQEGADAVMVKPAVAYLDIIQRVKTTFHVPVAAYHVSGEYAMIKAAAQNGWIDEKRVALETLYSIKRAGADMILTYYARDVARWLEEVTF